MQTDLDEVLNSTPGLVGTDCDPKALIRTVNALHPLGKERALDMIADFLSKDTDGTRATSQGMFLVLRCLFEVPDPPGFMPPVQVGALIPPEPTDTLLIPRFPLVLLGDIPISLLEGVSRAGMPQHPVKHAMYFRQNGIFRAKPLMPTNRPLDALASFQASRLWLWDRPYPTKYPTIFFHRKHINYSFGRFLMRAQFLRLLSSVLPTPLYAAANRKLWHVKQRGVEWQNVVQYMSRLSLRWDTELQDYIAE